MARESFYQWMSKQVRDLRWLVYPGVVILNCLFAGFGFLIGWASRITEFWNLNGIGGALICLVLWGLVGWLFARAFVVPFRRDSLTPLTQAFTGQVYLVTVPAFVVALGLSIVALGFLVYWTYTSLSNFFTDLFAKVISPIIQWLFARHTL